MIIQQLGFIKNMGSPRLTVTPGSVWKSSQRQKSLREEKMNIHCSIHRVSVWEIYTPRGSVYTWFTTTLNISHVTITTVSKVHLYLFFNVNTWLIRSPLIVCFRATCCLLKSFNRKCQHRTQATSTWKNQRDVNYIWPRSTGTIKQTPGLRWSLPCVKVSHVLCLHYTAGFEIVLQCGVCPGSLFVFDVFIHHTRSNDF